MMLDLVDKCFAQNSGYIHGQVRFAAGHDQGRTEAASGRLAMGGSSDG
jgi:hypothetical protein